MLCNAAILILTSVQNFRGSYILFAPLRFGTLDRPFASTFRRHYDSGRLE